MERYIQLVRSYSHHHSPRYSITLTLLYELNNLRSVFSGLSTPGCNASHSAVTQSYVRTVDTSRTMTTLAWTVVRLPVYVIKTIGNIMSIEYPDLCIVQTEFENHCVEPANSAKSFLYCRVDIIFILLQSLHSSIL